MDAGNEPTNDRERAFCEAVQHYASDGWNPNYPKQCTVEIGNERLTLRAVCLLVIANDRVLPERTIVQLVESLPDRHKAFHEMLVRAPTYLAGAQCLALLMDEREEASR